MIEINNPSVSLVIFTCENRELLLQKSYASFLNACDFNFDKIILAIDGQVNQEIITQINPHLIIHHCARRGYVNSISKALKLIDTPYFFWLEDDWLFHKNFDLNYQLGLLQNNSNWAQVLFSKWGPLELEFKIHPVATNLYQTTFGFSANPCLCNTKFIQSAFLALENSPKGDKLGEHGFENFLTENLGGQNILSVIIDPVDHLIISHDGYLESTPRNWHMTNSLETKTARHLLTIPSPSNLRRCMMLFKLLKTFTLLSINQFFNNKIYEYCFRVIASAKTVKSNND